MERKRTIHNRQLRQQRVRTRVRGSTKRPRLSISISNRHVSAQLIDDQTSRTLATSTSVGNAKLAKESLNGKAAYVGDDIAKRATKVKIKAVVFDRGQKLYHGRVRALAEAARSRGLEF